MTIDFCTSIKKYRLFLYEIEILKIQEGRSVSPMSLTKHPETRGGINESMLPCGRKVNYEKIIIKKEDTTNQIVK